MTLADGQHAEICLAIDAWIGRAAAGLARGVLLLIDYGHPAAELYDPKRRAAGTLATYRGHRVGDDPYQSIGRQDLTAHVDISAVGRAAEARASTTWRRRPRTRSWPASGSASCWSPSRPGPA